MALIRKIPKHFLKNENAVKKDFLKDTFYTRYVFDMMKFNNVCLHAKHADVYVSMPAGCCMFIYYDHDTVGEH